MFQVFQLTALVIRGPATRGQRFIKNLDRVAIGGGEACGVLLCVQDFVRSPLFTQKGFILESGLTMFSETAAITNSINSASVCAPWSLAGTANANQVVSDLRACWDRVVWCRRTAKDTSERWYHGGTPRSQTPSRPGVLISDVVEEGRVEYVPVALPALGPPRPNKMRSSPASGRENLSEPLEVASET